MKKTTFFLALAIILNNLGCKEKSHSTNKPAENQAQQDLKEMKVENWGPQETPEGTKFNIQPNGLSAMWVKVKGVSRHPKTHVLFGGNEISGQDIAVQDEAVTFIVRDELFSTPGQYEVAIVEGESGRRIAIGKFIVR